MRRIVLGPMDWWTGWFGGAWGVLDPDDPSAGPRRGFFRPGEVRLALLSLLADGSAHGYDLMKRLEERSGRLYHASAGTVYPVLQQLEDEGLISAQTESGKKVYSLAAAGREELHRNQGQVDAIWQRAERWHEVASHLASSDAVALAAAVGQLTKAVFRAAKGHPDLTERIRAILLRAIEEVRALANGPQGEQGSGE